MESDRGSVTPPPHSIEAEQAVLGGVMLDSAALAQVGGWLTELDFYRREHALIYRSMLACEGEGVPLDAVTLGEWLEGRGLDKQIGGSAYLTELQSTTPSAANIVAYAEIVRERASMRRLVGIGHDLLRAGMDPQGRSSRDIAGTATHALLDLGSSPTGKGARTMRQVGLAWFAKMQEQAESDGEGVRGLASPWPHLDKLTGGMHPGDLIVLAGRPSMGKSAAAIGMALAAAVRGARTMFFSLEMTDISLYNRAVAAVGNVPLAFLRDPNIESDYWGGICSAVSDLSDLPLLLDESAGLTIDQIVMRASREHIRSPLGLVIIDHMHIIDLAGVDEVRAYGEISRKAKALAKRLGCPVVLIAQLNRGVESRTDKRPRMSDLRASGNIEQDADQILLLYRDEYYYDDSPFRGWVELIASKLREGETGTVWLRNELGFGRIVHTNEPPPKVNAKAEIAVVRGYAG